MSKEEMEKELKNILDEYSPLLQDVTVDDVKEKVKEKRLPRLKESFVNFFTQERGIIVLSPKVIVTIILFIISLQTS